MSSNREFTHYIAIDFGTAGCGIAISTSIGDTPHMYQAWLPGGHTGPQKCPTIMLLDDNGDCEEFGKKNLLLDYRKGNVKNRDRIDEYSLFQYFKMHIYEEKNVTHDLMITALDGKKLPAVTVFSKALQYMRKIVIDDLDKQVAHPNRSILWILTVPAIWSHAARQVMRTAATQAGFDSGNNSLMLALEPEAASIYCIEIDDLLHSASSNNSHLVVDCGGGTVDIAVHRWGKYPVTDEFYVDEIHKVHGGPWGSFAVNKQFDLFLKELLQLSDTEVLTHFEAQWNKLIYDDFEQSKCMFGPADRLIKVDIPSKIVKYIRNKNKASIEGLIKLYGNNLLEWDDEEEAIVISHDFMLGFFKPVFDQIIHSIDSILKSPECRSVNKIMLVGGFAVNQYLYDDIAKSFPNCSLERGQNPWLSVVLGAVKFGKNHDVIRSRLMRQTLGIETFDDFVHGYHDEKYKKKVEDKLYCTKVFTKFFDVDEKISVEQSGTEVTFTPAANVEDKCQLKVYGSYDKDVKYVDDCYVAGTVVIDGLPSPRSGLSREVKVRADATGPQITITAKCNGNTKQLKLDFLLK